MKDSPIVSLTAAMHNLLLNITFPNVQNIHQILNNNNFLGSISVTPLQLERHDAKRELIICSAANIQFDRYSAGAHQR